MLLIWWLLASGGSLVDPGPLTICKMLLIWRLLASGGSLVLGSLTRVPLLYKQNAFDLAAFGFWGLPGRPGSPYYM